MPSPRLSLRATAIFADPCTGARKRHRSGANSPRGIDHGQSDGARVPPGARSTGGDGSLPTNRLGPGRLRQFGPSPMVHATFRYASRRATHGEHPKNRMRRVQGGNRHRRRRRIVVLLNPLQSPRSKQNSSDKGCSDLRMDFVKRNRPEAAGDMHPDEEEQPDAPDYGRRYAAAPEDEDLIQRVGNAELQNSHCSRYALLGSRSRASSPLPAFPAQPGTGICSVRPRMPWRSEGVEDERLECISKKCTDCLVTFAFIVHHIAMAVALARCPEEGPAHRGVTTRV